MGRGVRGLLVADLLAEPPDVGVNCANFLSNQIEDLIAVRGVQFHVPLVKAGPRTSRHCLRVRNSRNPQSAAAHLVFDQQTWLLTKVTKPSATLI